MKNFKILPHRPKTLNWWFNHKDEIDFDPPYQRRGRLWSVGDKAYLIDSIINGFDIPKLYLADFQFGQSSLNKAKLPYAIIDGKQRLEAVFDFFEYNLVLSENFTYLKNPSLRLGGSSLKDLRGSYPLVAEKFENASLDVMSVIAEEEVEINEIFIRLNKSKPLTGAEVRNAVSGPVVELTRVITKHEFFVENIRFSVKRSADLNAAAKILLFEYSGALVATRKCDLDKFLESNVAPEQLELAGRRVLDNLTTMSEVFIPKDSLLSSANVVPTYYWFIRQVNDNGYSAIRLFLLNFEKNRRNSHDQDDVNGDVGSRRSFAQFNALNQRPNDLKSYVGRVEILENLYNKWKK